MQTKEIWKSVKGFEQSHKVSSWGRVKVIEHCAMVTRDGKKITYHRQEHFLTPRRKGKGTKNGHEYYSVGIGKRPNGTRDELLLHRLVAKTFIKNPKNKPEVNHDDGNKANCRVDNLTWMTSKENKEHAIKTGLIIPKKKKK